MRAGKALLDEADDRGVVEGLRAHPAALRPRRDHQHRHALTQAIAARHVLAAAGERFTAGIDRRQAVAARRGKRRNEMVEEAVVLVVGDQQHRLAPHLGVGREDLQDLVDVPRAVVGRPVRVLGEGLGRGDPRHLRQRAVLHVALEDVEVAVTGRHVGAGARLVVQRVARLRVLVLLEVEQRVVAVVADVGIAGPAPRAIGVEAGADVLVDLPRDAGALQHLGIGGPAVAQLGIVDDRPAARAVVADVAGPHVVAVGIGRGRRRAMVGVAKGEGVGQRVVERCPGASGRPWWWCPCAAPSRRSGRR